MVRKYGIEKKDWPREIKISQKLIKNYNGYSFLNSLKDLKLPSLAWFLTDEGKKFIATEQIKDKLILERPEKIELQENKLGQDKKVCQKPKSMLEFIRYGKKT